MKTEMAANISPVSTLWPIRRQRTAGCASRASGQPRLRSTSSSSSSPAAASPTGHSSIQRCAPLITGCTSHSTSSPMPIELPAAITAMRSTACISRPCSSPSPSASAQPDRSPISVERDSAAGMEQVSSE